MRLHSSPPIPPSPPPCPDLHSAKRTRLLLINATGNIPTSDLKKRIKVLSSGSYRITELEVDPSNGSSGVAAAWDSQPSQHHVTLILGNADLGLDLIRPEASSAAVVGAWESLVLGVRARLPSYEDALLVLPPDPTGALKAAVLELLNINKLNTDFFFLESLDDALPEAAERLLSRVKSKRPRLVASFLLQPPSALLTAARALWPTAIFLDALECVVQRAGRLVDDAQVLKPLAAGDDAHLLLRIEEEPLLVHRPLTRSLPLALKGYTLLHLAAHYGRAALVPVLVGLGAPVNGRLRAAPNEPALAPLHVAALRDQAEAFSALLDEGADFSLPFRSRTAETALSVVAAQRRARVLAISLARKPRQCERELELALDRQDTKVEPLCPLDPSPPNLILIDGPLTRGCRGASQQYGHEGRSEPRP